jgi:hypothetical protein
VVTVQTGPEGHPLPEIRTAASSAPESDRSTGGATLGLLVECDLRWAGWRRALHRALEDSGGRPVDLRIVATAPGDVRAVLDELGDAPLARLGAFAAGGHLSGSDLLDVARRAAHERGAQVVGGVRSHFTELTRNAEALAPLDVPLAFSITPFMHDRSGHQLVESLAMQRAVVRDAAEIAAGRRLHVGPVTLGARMNAVSTSPFDPGETDIDRTGYGPATTPGATDERQTSPALAAWVVGSIEALAAPTVDSLSYFEEWGPRGISVGDRPTPAGRVLEWAAELSGWSRVGVSAAVDVSDAPVSAQLAELGLAAVGAARGGERVVLLGNIGGRSVTLSPAQVVDWHRSSDGALGEGSVVLAPGDAVRLRLAPQPSSV